MSEFVTVAKVGDLRPGSGRTVDVKGIRIALFNVNGSYFAVDNTCPHAGGLIGEGSLGGEIVTCPWHGWQFNVRTGEREGNPNFTVACCPVRIQGEEIQIAIPDNFNSF